jgi:DNA-binding transcriptional LysR family regulator
MHRIDWDDLRYVLAVAEQGSLAGAARALAVNHTTVLRRINAFEEAHGVRLFERLPTGYALTAGGEQMLAAAREMSGVVAALERRLAGQDLRLEGTLRITTTDTLMGSVLPGILASFRAAHPGIRLEVSVSNLMANLTKRDADVAIRPAREAPETLIGRRVAAVASAIYAGPVLRAAVEAAAAGTNDLIAFPWVAPDDTLAGSSVARWMRAHVPEARIAVRADSLLSLRQAAAAGLGLAALPCYLGDASPSLRRAGPPVEEMATALWILTHEDLRRTARVRAFTEFAAEALGRERDLLEGRRPWREDGGG